MLDLSLPMECDMRLACIAILLGVAGILPSSGWSSDPMSGAQQAADTLLAADRRFAADAATVDMVDALSAQFADSVVMPAGAEGLAEGRSAVVEALKARPGAASARVAWAPVGVGISADGEHGYTYGFMQQTGAEDPVPLKYLAYWVRQQADWRVIAYRLARRAAGEVDRDLRYVALPEHMHHGAPDENSTVAAARTLADAEIAFSEEAQQSGLEAAFVKFGTPESMNMGGAGGADFVYGASHIAKAVSVGQPVGGSTVHWGPERVVVAGSGDLGVSIGYIRHNAPDADGKPQAPIPFFTVWRREGTERPWRYVAE